MQTEDRSNIKRSLLHTIKDGVYKKYIKRLVDLIFSITAIIILSPLLLVIGVLVRLKLGNPAIFKQERPGLKEKIFTLYKFRTMTNKCDEKGELLPDEDRLTKLGRFLCSTSLDELPELWNIVRGEMTFVGPRPLLKKYLPYYREKERQRSEVRPGITGLAQISGRNTLTWDERFKTDIDYVNKLSFILDVKIILGTVSVVLKRKNILLGSKQALKDLDVERKEEFDNEFK